MSSEEHKQFKELLARTHLITEQAQQMSIECNHLNQRLQKLFEEINKIDEKLSQY